MKQFFAFVKKEFYHIFRDVRTMLILLAMPIIQIILFGFAITTEVRNVNIAMMVDGRIDALDTPANLRARFEAGTMDEVFRKLARKATR